MAHWNRYAASLLWIACAAGAAPSSDSRQQAKSLASAYDEVMEKCEFQAHFESKMWSIVSESGSLEAATKKSLNRAYGGYMAKRGAQFRFKATTGGGMLRDVSEDGRLLIELIVPEPGASAALPPGSPPGGDLVPAASLVPATEPNWGKPLPMCDLSPVHLFPSKRVLADLLESDAGVTVEVAESGDVSTVSITKEFDGTTGKVLVAEFDTSGAIPQLTRRTDSTVDADGAVTRTIVWTMSDFRPAGEVYVPAVIERRAWDAAYQRDGHKNVWIVARWTSADLGKRPVEDADFDVKVPAGTHLTGFAGRAGDVSDGETLSLATFAPKDVSLNTPVILDGNVESTGEVNLVRWLAFGVTGIVVLVLLAMVLIKRRGHGVG